MAYTAEDFEYLIPFREGLEVDDILTAALRIASAVMRPGVIEQAMFEFKYNDPPALADAIRSALTDAKP